MPPFSFLLLNPVVGMFRGVSIDAFYQDRRAASSDMCKLPLTTDLWNFYCCFFNRYKLAKDIDGQLKQMVHDLKSIIDHLNTANTQQQDSDDPVGAWLFCLHCYSHCVNDMAENYILILRNLCKCDSNFLSLVCK